MPRSESSTKSIDVVIVSYNSGHELPLCINPLLQNTSVGLHINVIVVDNASSDDSIEIATKLGVKVITNSVNLGFAQGVNAGIRASSSEYVLLLNPDAIITADDVQLLINRFDSDKQIGAVSPSFTDNVGEQTDSGYYLRAPSFMWALLQATPLGSKLGSDSHIMRKFYHEFPLTQSRAVSQTPGACLLTSRKVLDRVGLLDEGFAIWFEDVDWSYRARKQKYELLFCPEIKVVHIGGVYFSTWKSIDKEITYYVGMKRFFRKHKPVSGVFVMLMITSWRLLAFILTQKKSHLEFLRGYWRLSIGVLPK